ncbi:NAD(P)H-dependent oxidoreductase [Dechloromonas denitrificans]|uniref:NAD(P)H-dependent oxidoreductase n=1 Tax=Dechloromonas denitrificans TaxID=281362 RepID=UPI001CFC3FAD|nr:NAD(P)H-dependent oxidoreductase [Dechloromonas denitrificans]UCV08719.1 NAD(P)H-dependent oxidoreductase [Dechloromonas denitrificans]
MNTLVVIAHPLSNSLTQALAQVAIKSLTAAGHEVVVENLYDVGFSPVLTEAERQSYYRLPFDASAIAGQVERLLAAEALVLVFPTWWFGFPAILKGWFDRVWGPGVAYDHASDLGPIRPRLLNLKHALAITSLGSPWWVDRLLMWQPVRRILKTALLGTCAPACRFRMLSLYQAEKLDSAQVRRFSSRIERALVRWS